MPKRFKIIFHDTLYKRTKLEVNNMYFSCTDLESYYKEYQSSGDVFEFHISANIQINVALVIII